MKNRIELAKFFAQKGYKRGAEIGVFRGYYSTVLLDHIPGLNLLCVDSWSTDTGWGINKNLSAFTIAIDNLKKYPNATVLKGDSIDVASLVIDNSLDFIYIDADHSYEAVKADLNAWAPKVKSGGVVAGHDYFEARTLQVIPAVDEYAKEHGLKVETTEWDHENLQSDERQPNWYFIKQ